MDFDAFFSAACPGRKPYPYQRRFALSQDVPHLVRAPTSAGKTAAAIVGHLWRFFHSGQATPRRLVYCLPMRVLVEQSVREARGWIENLGLTKQVDLHCLMGGVDTEQWFLHPERPAILIGTQDMLLSRALNRGYAASRFHWPIDFGLLNNDCMWVFDEPQLMGSGVSTSSQLAGLREALGTMGDCPSVWMSATLEPEWLDTIDFRGKFSKEMLELSDADYSPALPLHERMTAKKTLSSFGNASPDAKEVARAILQPEIHVPGMQTLVVLNTVDRAKAVFRELQQLVKKAKANTPNLLLVHSRFRPKEREILNEKLQDQEASADRIIVATQVVEAGVDISARTLVTDLAPWASLVQRMGRCNRTGSDGPGRVIIIDLEEKHSLPYGAEDMEFARRCAGKLEGMSVSPQALEEFRERENLKLPFEHKHVLRRRDLIDLFDTSPDLSGNDIDISRFVRGDDPDTDVQVFWRNFGAAAPMSDEPAANRRELCSVPAGKELREFLKKLKAKKDLFGYVWDHLDEAWRSLRDPERAVRPGLTILLPSAAGGYSLDLGWDAESPANVDPVEIDTRQAAEGTGSDPNSCGPELTVAQHTQNVCAELEMVLRALPGLPEDWRKHLARAARWHDAGKAHPVFQHTMRQANSKLNDSQLWAKSGTSGGLFHCRKHFRHELASALAALQHGLPFEVAYLIATHHGKVRLSIRTLPDERPQPEDAETMFAQGVWDGDKLPDVDLGGETCGELTIDLSPMRLGGKASWTGRSLALRDLLGPFQLAYFEALLRAADVRASKNERKEFSHA